MTYSGRAIVARGIGVCVLIALVTALTVCSAGAKVGLDDLAGPLRSLALQARASGAPAELVQVVIYFDSPGAAAAFDAASFGGQPQIQRDRRLQALIPADRLLDVARVATVVTVTPPERPVTRQVRPAYGAHLSEGVALTGANLMHAAGFRGRGARIAVVDAGFQGYRSAQIPTPERVIAYTRDGSAESGGNHGTMVAETIADMAPEASLALIAVDTSMSIEQAIDHIIGSGYHIASMSLGLLDGPFDGSHPVSLAVRRARTAGVLWVNSAGNAAQQHWMGTWTDADGDRYMEWAPGVEDMPLQSAGAVAVWLSWFETAGPLTAQDYDLVLFDSTGNEVARSGWRQNGDDKPSEILATTTSAGTFNLRIQAYSTDTTKPPDKFQLYTYYQDLPASFQIPATSLDIPAESAFAVGATRGIAPNVDTIEPFSSRGPSVTGLLKPDICGPDGTVTSLGQFFGTSCAAPHVAGAAALFYSEDSSRTAGILATGMTRLAVDLGPPGPDNSYGAGRVKLAPGAFVTAPIIRIIYPANGEVIAVSKPQIRAQITSQAGVDPATLKLTLDGTVYDLSNPALKFNADTGAVTFNTPSPLSAAAHRVSIDVMDVVKQAARTAVSSFRYSPPMLDAGLRMFALPYVDLESASPAALFGLPASDFAFVRWVPSDIPNWKYHFYPDPLASLVPPDAGPGGVVSQPPAGLGYFVNLPTDVRLNITGQPMPNDAPYTIQLTYGVSSPRGWNMIGTPFIGPTDWGGARFITAGKRQVLKDAVEARVTDGVLFTLRTEDGRTFYDFAPDPLAAIMQPYTAYWVHVWKDTAVELAPTVSGAAVSAAHSSGAPPSKDNWQFTIVTSSGAALDRTTVIGVAPDATDGHDPGADVVKPPALTSELQTYMPRMAWGDRSGVYARDIRGPGLPAHVWDIEVLCSAGNTPVTVRWPDLNTAVPSGVRLTLRDLDSGKEVYMRTASEYTFTTPSSGGTRRLQVVATTGGGDTLVVTGVTASEVPSGGVAIAYQVTQAASVSVEVRNISGVPIKAFVPRLCEAHSPQTLLWSGVSDRGTRAPAGRYLARITASAENGQTVQVIRPFVLSP